MPRLAYVNGRFVPHAQAAVHIEDRGYQFADGVYEVWAVMGGRLSDSAGHFARLKRSLGELRIAMPMSVEALRIVLAESVRRNRLRNGLLYLQITRGVAPRDHPFPDPPPPPAIVITAKRTDPAANEARAMKGAGVISTPENRWGRCDIKTIGLLPNVLAKQAAREAGAIEAWYVDDLGLVTEGGSSNAWIVDAEGRLRTRDIQANILRGVTRSDPARGRRTRGHRGRTAPVHGRRGQGRAGSLHNGRRHAGDAHHAYRRRHDRRWRGRPRGEAAPTALYRGGSARRARRDQGLKPLSNDKKQNLQDAFLNAVRKTRTPLTIFLVNGVKLQGVVSWFDNFCVLLRRDGQAQLVYKHAISTIMPSGPVNLYEPEFDDDEAD